MQTNLTCCFCAELKGFRNQEFGRLYPEIRSRVVWRNQSFAIIPSIGQIVPGYLLLVPFQHVCSFGELDVENRKVAEDLIKSLWNLLALSFAEPVVFEHGNRPSAEEGGCGITHAHIHFVPVPSRLKRLPSMEGLQWDSLPPSGYIEILGKITSDGGAYLFYEDQLGDKYASPVNSIPSQFFRRWLAEELHVSNWDWRLAGYEPNLVHTLDVLTTRPPAGLSERWRTLGNSYKWLRKCFLCL